MALGPKTWAQTRAAISALLAVGNKHLQQGTELNRSALTPLTEVTLHLPITVGDYTDFYASKEHATNVGTLFRDPDNALMPNWLHIPIGYNGRASTVVVSGTNFHRPLGQINPPGSDGPIFSKCQKLDIEL